MSGIDEQNRHVPMCPICENVPMFWILYPTMAENSTDGWYWLFSEIYAKRHGHTKLECKEGDYRRRPTLDDIMCIVCSDDNNHKFVADHSIFQKIIRCAERLEK